MRASLPDQTRLSQVHLRTADLENALEFYSGILKLSVADQHGAQARLTPMPNTPTLLVLSQKRNAPRRPQRTLGLYHLALRYPARKDLAQAYRRIVRAGYPVTGASDHGVSEAIYLNDPDGNGVELYADRPRAQWQWHNDQIAMVTTPLDLDNLLATLTTESATGLPALPELGHIHFHVADLTAAERFYSEFLGLAVTQRSYPGALFFAAGAYHHHVAVNVWAGKAPPPPNSVGLVSYRFEVPVSEILYCLGHRAPLLGYQTRTEGQEQHQPIIQIRDPNGTWLEVQASANTPAIGAKLAEYHCG